jgi:methylated-DNA-[protein]-cysteine S-methyltransferase
MSVEEGHFDLHKNDGRCYNNAVIDSSLKVSNISTADYIYSLLRKVPPGMVTTYGELARAAGTKAYRAVGRILNSNPFAPEVPCHRVVMSDGKIGGYAFGVPRKIAILAEEGVEVCDDRIQDFHSKLFRFL